MPALARLTLAATVLFAFQQTALAAFPDVPSAHTNAEAIVYVQKEGIVDGYPDGTYRPDQKINRAEFTKIVMGAISNRASIDGCGTSVLADFADVPANAWYSKYVCLAHVRGIVSGHLVTNGKPQFRAGENINLVEAAKILAGAFTIGEPPPDCAQNPSICAEAAQRGEIWYKRHVEALAERNAIPITIRSFDQQITRGEMAEMIFRLREHLTSKSSQSYDSLASGGSSDLYSYTDLHHVFTLKYPRSWSVKAEENGATFTLPLGPVKTHEQFIKDASLKAEVTPTCPALQPTPGTYPQNITLDGHVFLAIEQNDGAAGTIYTTLTFSSKVSDTACVVLTRSIVISNGAQETHEDTALAAEQVKDVQDAIKDVIKNIDILQ